LFSAALQADIDARVVHDFFMQRDVRRVMPAGRAAAKKINLGQRSL